MLIILLMSLKCGSYLLTLHNYLHLLAIEHLNIYMMRINIAMLLILVKSNTISHYFVKHNTNVVCGISLFVFVSKKWVKY